MVDISKRIGMVALGAMCALGLALAISGCDSHRCDCPRCPDNSGQLGTGELE